MPNKIPSEIIEIVLSERSYSGTNTTIYPTFINYFFGNNGTGKTTLAKAIKNGVGIEYAPGKTAADYNSLVFDQDFITQNMHNYHNMPGVFTINEVNADIIRQIDEKSEEQAAAGKALNDAKAGKKKKGEEKDALLKQFQKDCWDKCEPLRKRFDKTQEGKQRAKQFTDEIIRTAPKEHNLDGLQRLFDSAYSDTARTYALFNTIPDVSVLDSVDGRDVLGIVIVNTADTDFAKFIDRVGSTEWVRKGHAEFHEKAGDRCPYCSQTLQEGFAEMLTASFNDQYAENITRLNGFLEAYRNAANTLFVSLQKIPEDLYPAIVVKPFNDKMNEVKAIISQNLDTIREKIAEPGKAVTIEDTAAVLQELTDIIAEFNRLIGENNAVVAAGPRKRTECKTAVFELMAFQMQGVVATYKQNEADLDSEDAAFDSVIAAQGVILERVSGEIKDLRNRTVETDTAKDSINTKLRDCGFQGFELRASRPEPQQVVKPDGTTETVMIAPPNTYDVVRTDTGDIATDLSEGEKNFIAFLYFYHTVFGSETADGDTREKIVVIDDPVSSMDSCALFVVSSLVRRMIEICRNCADDRNPVIPGKFIKQIFILTHNAYFHREVTYCYANHWDFVSFYLIRKSNMHSSIKLCDMQNPEEPTQRINVNPVRNSYAALWEEYKDVHTAVPMMNVIRRILEYYFLQLCGYEGATLRQIILEDPDHKYALTHDADGNEDYTKYDLAYAMLSYIAASTNGINDGINFVDDVIDEDVCRDTFHMIFDYMNQNQHFDMMMGIK